jgi:hypothetical protein
LGLQLKYSLTKVQNFVGSSKSCVKKALIDHCMISQYHPKVDVLTKWMVQMMKWGLQKYGV